MNYERERNAIARSQPKTGVPAAYEPWWKHIQAQGTPSITMLSENRCLLDFFYEGNNETENVLFLSSIWNYYTKSNQMSQIPSIPIWHKRLVLPANLSFLYQFAPNSAEQCLDEVRKNVQSDPWNADRFDEQTSRVTLCQYAPDPYTCLIPDMPQGTIEDHHLMSNVLGERRFFSLYLSSGYKKTGKADALLIIFDGHVYCLQIPLPVICEHLIQDRLFQSPLIVFVEQQSREKELHCSRNFSAFITMELFPFLRSRYDLSGVTRETTVLVGSSLGGLQACFMCMSNPDVYGAAISQSGSFWSKPEHIEVALKQCTKKVRIYTSVGTLETFLVQPELPSVKESNYAFHTRLASSGHISIYHEFAGGHHPYHWKDDLSTGLRSIFPGRKTNKAD